MAVAASAAMLALISIRHERMPLSGSAAAPVTSALRTARQATDAIAPPGAPIRKCMSNGKTVYSNTGCNGTDQPGHAVELHDTRGIEAPKIPAAASTAPQPAPDLRERMIERAVSR
jgi:hypothetical protein